MKKILVVDDEAEIVNLCCFVLEEAGYSVSGAYSGQQALAKVEAEQPDLILLDVMMPGMSGIDVCRQIHEPPREQSDCIVIMYTADDSHETLTSSLAAGAQELVSKETPIFELADKINAYLN